MQDLAYPAHRELEQEFALLIALERAARTTTGPPPHARQFRGIVLLIERDQDDRQPMEPRHKNGAAGGAVVALLERTGPYSSATMLSGFSQTLSSHMASACTPASFHFCKRLVARSQRNTRITSADHFTQCSRFERRLVQASALSGVER